MHEKSKENFMPMNTIDIHYLNWTGDNSSKG